MPSLITSLFIGLLALAPEAIAAPQSGDSAKALYFISNNEQNAVGAVAVRRDGSLKGARMTATGGNGAVHVNADGSLADRDGLAAQSSIFRSGDNLFAVNAGSNTVSMLAINKFDPTRLSLVGAPATVPGDFPNTVAASAKNGLVCVATTGAASGVSCAPFDSKTGIGAFDDLRSIPIGQTTPPSGPLGTITQVLWSEDESRLLTIVKGDPTMNKTGFVSTYNIKESDSSCAPTYLSYDEVRSTPQGSAVLFGSLIIPGTNNIFSTDAGFGASILAIDEAGKASTVASQAIEGQVATCWVTVAAKTNSAYVTDILQPRLIEMSLTDASIIATLDISNTGSGGMIDLANAGDMVYALSPGNADAGSQIIVTKIGGAKPKFVQAFDLERFGVGTILQGMTLLK